MGAPKGNKHGVGHGRPVIHTDPKEVDKLIDDYFEWIKGERSADGKKYDWERAPEPPTVTGLTLHLGFANKSSLYDYSRKDSFSNSIKRAISRIEKHHEIAIAHGDKCTGNIFALKNFGWRDSIDVNQKSQIDFRYSKEERKKRIKEIIEKKDAND